MPIDAPIELCVVNGTEQAMFAMLRDGRTKLSTARAAGGSVASFREPVFQRQLPRIEPGQTGCASFGIDEVIRPHLVVWSASPTHILLNGREDDATCRPPRELKAGARVNFVYRKWGLGWGDCDRLKTR